MRKFLLQSPLKSARFVCYHHFFPRLRKSILVLISLSMILGGSGIWAGNLSLAQKELTEANTLAESGKFELASEHYLRLAIASDKRGDGNIGIDARLNRARTLLKLQQSSAARQSLDEAAAALTGEVNSSWTAKRLASLGELYHLLDVQLGGSTFIQKALIALEQGNTIASSQGQHRVQSLALGRMGSIAERFGQWDEALAYTRAASVKAQEVEALDLLYQWQWQAARILEAQHLTAAALSSYELAIDTLERVRPVLSSNPTESFSADIAPLYFDTAALLLGQHAQNDNAALQQKSLRQVRGTIEKFKVAEILDYFGDECVIGDDEQVDADLLDRGVAVIYPIIFDDRMEVLTSIDGVIQRHTAQVSKRELGKTTQEFRRGLVRRPTHRYRKPGEALYNWLIAPVIDDLRVANVNTLVFVADGSLRSIPPGALYDGTRFLVEEFAVASSPGLSLTSPSPLQKGEIEVLASGLSLSVDGFSALPAVSTELDMIGQLYGATELRDESFRIQPVTEEISAGNYSIVHIATHGQFKADYKDSFLLTYDGRMTMDTLEDVIGMRRYMNEPVELLMLSACETAVGDDRAALGLAGIALKAGARSAVASLWSINDAASAALVGDFYTALKTGDYSKAQTLQKAQLGLIGNDQYSHPFYWSAYLLIGNWL